MSTKRVRVEQVDEGFQVHCPQHGEVGIFASKTQAKKRMQLHIGERAPREKGSGYDSSGRGVADVPNPPLHKMGSR